MATDSSAGASSPSSGGATRTRNWQADREPRSAELFPLSERYEQLSRLGSGGMGVVYEVFDREMNTRVALKTLRRMSPRALLLLKHEFRVLAGIVHPHLVLLHDLHPAVQGPFFTMELVDGCSPAAFVAGQTRVPSPVGTGDGRWNRLLLVARQLVAAVAALHARGRLHHDIKPSNLRFDLQGRLVLLDFGLARLLGAEEHRAAGTLAYVAPEQLEGEVTGPAADWYGVGSTLYELATGSPPYGASRRQLIRAKRDLVVAPPVRDGEPECPTLLATLIDALLAPRPEDRPDGSLLARALGVGSGAVDVLQRLPTVPVGRGPLLRALAEVLDGVATRGPTVVRLSGVSGVGKSTLLHHFLASLDRSRTLVLAGRCYEREWLPFNAFEGLIGALAEELGGLPRAARLALVSGQRAVLTRLFPELGVLEAPDGELTPVDAAGLSMEFADSAALRDEAFGALATLLAEHAGGRLVVLAIDDAQWADRDSAALLAHLLRQPTLGLLVLLALRAPGTLTLLESAPRWVEKDFEVGPLDAHNALALLRRDLGEALDEGTARRLVAQADGLPLLLDELARAVRDGVPADLGAALQQRVQALPDGERALLELLSVAGRPQSLAFLARALPELDLTRAGAALADRGLLVASREGGQPGLGLRHDRVAQVALSGLGPTAQRALHLRLAAHLLEERGDVEQIAGHLLDGGDAVRGREFALLGAESARFNLAFDRAARLLRAAIALETNAATAALLQERLGEILANDARAAEAAAAYLDAAGSTDAAGAQRLLHLGAEQLMRSGRIDEGRALLERLLSGQGLSLPRSPLQATALLVMHRARLAWRGLEFVARREEDLPVERLARADAAWSAAVTLALVDAVSAASFQVQGLLEALELGEPRRVARSLSAEAVFRAAFGNHDQARVLWERCARLVDAGGDAVDRAGVDLSASVCAYQRGDWAGSHRSALDALRQLRGQRANLSWIRSTVVVYRLAAAAHRGHIDELVAELPRELEHARARGDLHAVLHLSLGMPVPVATVLDGAEAGLVEADRVWELSPGRQYDQLRIHYLRTRAELALYLGDLAIASAAGNETVALISRSSASRLPVVRLWADELALRCLLLGAKREGLTASRRRRARGLLRSLQESGAPWAVAVARLHEAQLAALGGQTPAAVEALTEAAALLDAAGMALYRAAAIWGRGRLLGGVGGGAEVEFGLRWVEARGGRRPERLLAMIAPGFGSS